MPRTCASSSAAKSDVAPMAGSRLLIRKVYPPCVLRLAVSITLLLNGLLLTFGWWRLRVMPETAPHTGPLRALLSLAIVTLAAAAAAFALLPA